MSRSHYLRPIALAESPQSEEGETLRLAGGLVYASRFALIAREGGKIVSRQRFSAAELAIADLPDDARQQRDDFARVHAPLPNALRSAPSHSAEQPELRRAARNER